MLMYIPSHIARIVPAGSFNQALSRFRFMECLCSGTFAFLLPAVQRNSIAQKDWQNFSHLALLAFIRQKGYMLTVFWFRRWGDFSIQPPRPYKPIIPPAYDYI